MKILGIDPGSTSMGFAVLEQSGSTLTPVEYGTTAITKKELPEKLLQLAGILETLLVTHKPKVAGVEKIFFSKNKKTAFEVAQARGVILLVLLKHGLVVHEFTPAQIKIAVSNFGGADKLMVRKMVCKILALPALEGDDNAADALATAIATAGVVNRPY
jgi:crossover junction endodeoxyribonuclease RuvC